MASNQASASARPPLLHGASSHDEPARVDPPPFLLGGCPNPVPALLTWRTVDPATLSPDELVSISDSPCDWSVALLGGIVTPSRYVGARAKIPKIPPRFRLPQLWGPPQTLEKRRSGVLIGFNRGEWGGALLWYSPAGTLQGTLLHENVVEILLGVASSIVFVGLTHLSSDRGRAVEILEDAASFRVGRSVDLKSAPRAVVREASGSLLIITHRGLVRLTPDFTAHDLLNAHWRLIPNSGVVDTHGILYVGMRGIVAKLTPTADGYHEEWLLPPSKDR